MATKPNSAQNSYEIRRARRADRLRLTGPLLLIALGVMFLGGQFVPAWGIGKTWPVLLIIIGLSRLIEAVWAGRATPPS